MRSAIRLDDLPLFAPESDLAKAVCGVNGKDWASLVPMLERQGFPQIDPLMGGRYVPAVRAWFDANNGLRKYPETADGQEDWGRWGKRRRA